MDYVQSQKDVCDRPDLNTPCTVRTDPRRPPCPSPSRLSVEAAKPRWASSPDSVQTLQPVFGLAPTDPCLTPSEGLESAWQPGAHAPLDPHAPGVSAGCRHWRPNLNPAEEVGPRGPNPLAELAGRLYGMRCKNNGSACMQVGRRGLSVRSSCWIDIVFRFLALIACGLIQVRAGRPHRLIDRSIQLRCRLPWGCMGISIVFRRRECHVVRVARPDRLLQNKQKPPSPLALIERFWGAAFARSA